MILTEIRLALASLALLTTATFADYTAVLSKETTAASALYGRGIAKRRSGDRAGGDADVARANVIQANIAQVYAGHDFR